MDCFDLCSFKVTVENNKIIRLVGDKDHPVTRGITCKKAKNLVDRLNHPDRITHPMIKKKDGFEKCSWDAAFDLILDRLSKIKEVHGTKAILNYTGDGYGGLKNRIHNIFFNCFGGVTTWEGSLCWGAGIQAQKYDFGAVKGHFPDNILNANLILVWGRNPEHTNLHLYSLLKKARKNGSKIVVIDPVRTATAQAFDQYVRIKPATDGALALAMANIIIREQLHDKAFINDHVKGFNRFKEYVRSFTPEKTEMVTGIDREVIKSLAIEYANEKNASIQIGYGMQRYTNGGNAVRSIDALGSICGRIGKKGAGVNYAAKSMASFIYDLEKHSQQYAKGQRTFTVGELGKFIEDANNPPIKAVFVSSANPLTQSPDLERCKKAFSAVDFKVVFDHFLTDTAMAADLVLPAASVFEQEDVFATSMYSHVLNHAEKAVEPPEGVLPEFEFYLELAKRMGLENLGFSSGEEYLRKSVQPVLDKKGVSYEEFKTSYLRFEEDEVAWQDKKFPTPSGKIELYSDTAKADGLSGLATYEDAQAGSDKYPLRLLSCKIKGAMHSQGFAFTIEIPVVYINPVTADHLQLKHDDDVVLKSEKGSLKSKLEIDDAISPDIAFVHEGYLEKSGAVNFLTTDFITDMGKQAAYYDTFVMIEKI